MRIAVARRIRPRQLLLALTFVLLA